MTAETQDNRFPRVLVTLRDEVEHRRRLATMANLYAGFVQEEFSHQYGEIISVSPAWSTATVGDNSAVRSISNWVNKWSKTLSTPRVSYGLWRFDLRFRWSSNVVSVGAFRFRPPTGNPVYSVETADAAGTFQEVFMRQYSYITSGSAPVIYFDFVQDASGATARS